jgi:sugar lactone lactonase YvrE
MAHCAGMRKRTTFLIAVGTAFAMAGTGAGAGVASGAPATAGSTHPSAVTGSAAGSVVTLPVGPRPESITRGWGGTFYVSIQGAPDIGLNDGEIRTFNPETGAVSTFVTGLDNPRGLAFTGKYLVVTDTTVVWIIERSGAKRILAGPNAFPHPTAFFNDAAPADDGRAVYVSEMGARTLMRDPGGFLWPTDSPQALAIPATSRVYRISTSGTVTEAVTPSRKVLVMNGLTESNRPGHLLAAEFFYGNVVDVDLRTNRKNIVVTGFRAIDGLAQGRDGTIYASSFDGGTIWKVDPEGENPRILLQDVGRQTTADLYLDEKAQRLLVPDTLHGTIITLPTTG